MERQATEKAEAFQKMNTKGDLLLPNAWDAASARIFEEAGFDAIGTTSAGIAYGCGLRDGERISREAMMREIAVITTSVDVPVTADVEAGFRLNFSHGTLADHKVACATIRAMEREFGGPIGILQDLQGPKIRIRTLKEGTCKLCVGDTIRFIPSGEKGDALSIPLPDSEVFDAVSPGEKILLNDGRIQARIVECRPNAIAAELVVGVISDRKGVNFPATPIKLSALTAKDRRDLVVGIDLGVDWIALSFVLDDYLADGKCLALDRCRPWGQTRRGAGCKPSASACRLCERAGNWCRRHARRRMGAGDL